MTNRMRARSSISAEKHSDPFLRVSLVYRPEMPRATDIDDPDRKYIGSGDGQVTGSALSGSVIWDLFEEQGDTVCDARLVGVIETENQEKVSFETIGLFKRPDPKSSKWHLASDALFTAPAGAYTWLHEARAKWMGFVDAESYRHEYAVYFV